MKDYNNVSAKGTSPHGRTKRVIQCYRHQDMYRLAIWFGADYRAISMTAGEMLDFLQRAQRYIEKEEAE